MLKTTLITPAQPRWKFLTRPTLPIAAQSKPRDAPFTRRRFRILHKTRAPALPANILSILP